MEDSGYFVHFLDYSMKCYSEYSVELDFALVVVAFVAELAEVGLGTVAERAGFDIVVELELGIADLAAVAAFAVAADTAVVEFARDEVAVMELEVDKYVAVALDPDIAAAHDRLLVVAVSVLDIVVEKNILAAEIAAAVSAADTVETVMTIRCDGKK